MLTRDEALGRLLEVTTRTAGERVAIADALGRVLVEPMVRAGVDVPPFANSAMDGFALRSADAPGTLRIAGESAAGAGSPPAVGPGTAVRIMTGAPLPDGADAVVPVELVRESADAVIVPSVTSGSHVRGRGHDTAAGDQVYLPGAMTPPQLAVLASLGIGEVEVRRLPRVAILSTGDELVAPGEALGPGQIHDANGPALAAAVREAGGAPLQIPRVGDDAAAIERALAGAAASADLVVTSGGVSVGRHDHVRAVLERRGAIHFWRVAVQPGKPLAVGTLDGTSVIGLPGNPVSALVTFELFVRPMIRASLGLEGDGRARVRATPTERIGKDRDRRAYLRVVVTALDGRPVARPAGGQQSSQLRPLAEGNGLLVVPEGEAAAEPGSVYEVVLLGPIAGGAA
jgi:molybdopterin molybdotransferase